MLIFMSPLRMWLNSWPITACSWSRSSLSSAPCVTATAASSGEWPAAKALMPGSSGSTNTCGLRMRAAMAISSTMFSKRLRLRSPSSAVTGTPPSERATAAPPARISELLCQQAPNITHSTMSVVQNTNMGASLSTRTGLPPSPTSTTEVDHQDHREDGGNEGPHQPAGVGFLGFLALEELCGHRGQNYREIGRLGVRWRTPPAKKALPNATGLTVGNAGTG